MNTAYELTQTLIHDICSKYLDQDEQNKCRAIFKTYNFVFPKIRNNTYLSVRKDNEQDLTDYIVMSELGNVLMYR